MRLIDADALKKELCDTCGVCDIRKRRINCQVIEIINNMPTIETNPVVHGKWNCVNEDENVYMCSACGYEYILIDGTLQDNEMNYCCRCGADMRGE